MIPVPIRGQMPIQYVDTLIEESKSTVSSDDFGANGYAAIRVAAASFPLCEKTSLSGSCARATANKPLNDIDVLMIMKKGTVLNKNLVQNLRAHFETKLSTIDATLTSQRPLIGAVLPGKLIGVDDIDRVTFDIIPAVEIECDNEDAAGYEILTENEKQIKIWPACAKQVVCERNNQTIRLFSDLIRVLKMWNCSHAKLNAANQWQKPLEGFHLEAMCYDCDFGNCRDDDDDDGSWNTRKMLANLFAHIHTKLRNNVSIVAPKPPNVCIVDVDLGEYLTNSERAFSRDEVVALLARTAMISRQAVLQERNLAWRMVDPSQSQCTKRWYRTLLDRRTLRGKRQRYDDVDDDDDDDDDTSKRRKWQ